MRTFSRLYLAIGAGLCVEVSAIAQSSEEEELALVYGTQSTISLATGKQLPVRRAPAVATVISAQDIAATGATDLLELLETVPGIHVTRSSSYEPLITIRGIFSGPTNPQVLLMQDGVPLVTQFDGNKTLRASGLPIENIARIEVIRGPGSALYGADAYAGVINLITKTAADIPGTRLGVRSGSFSSHQGWLQHGGKVGAAEVAAYLSVGSTDGFREIVTADAQTARDQRFGTRASLAPGPVQVGHDDIDAQIDLRYTQWRLRAGYKLKRNEEVGAGVGSALDPVAKFKNKVVSTQLSWIEPALSPEWGAGASLSYSGLDLSAETGTYLQLSPPGTRFPTGLFPEGFIGNPGRKEKQIRFASFADYAGIASHRLRFGLGYEHLDLYETSTYKNYLLNPQGIPVPTGPVMDYNAIQPHIRPQQRELTYFSIQDEWILARDWALTAGLRHDRYSDFGGTTNPRLALVWDASADLTAKLLYGRAFRAPTFSEQYGINPVTTGNPALRPETIRTVEAALAWNVRPDTQLNLSVFHYQMTDLIRAIANPVPTPGSTYANVGSQNGRGFELEAVWNPGYKLRLSGHYAWQRAIDESINRDAGYAPRHHLYARAEWRFSGGWLASTQVNRVTDRRRTADDNRPAIADYTTFDLTLRHQRSDSPWEFSASLRNLFNADVREPSLAPGVIPNDLPQAGRAGYLQAVYLL